MGLQRASLHLLLDHPQGRQPEHSPIRSLDALQGKGASAAEVHQLDGARRGGQDLLVEANPRRVFPLADLIS
jgi:hypothetical protein